MAIENLLVDWTELDPDGIITVTSTRVTANGSPTSPGQITRSAASLGLGGFGAGFGDLSILFEFSAVDIQGRPYVFGFSDSATEIDEIGEETAAWDGFGFVFRDGSTISDIDIEPIGWVGGTLYEPAPLVDTAQTNTLYYATITFTDSTKEWVMEVFTDAARLNSIGATDPTVDAGLVAFDYCHIASGDSFRGDPNEYYVQNVDFQLSGAITHNPTETIGTISSTASAENTVAGSAAYAPTATIASTTTTASADITVPFVVGDVKAGSYAKFIGSGANQTTLTTARNTWVDWNFPGTTGWAATDPDGMVTENAGDFTLNVAGNYLVVTRIEFECTHNNRFTFKTRARGGATGTTYIEGSEGYGYCRNSNNNEAHSQSNFMVQADAGDIIDIQYLVDVSDGTEAGIWMQQFTSVSFIRLPDTADTAFGFYTDSTDTTVGIDQTAWTDAAWGDTPLVQNDTAVIEKTAGNVDITLKATGQYLVVTSLAIDHSTNTNRNQRELSLALNGVEVEGSRCYCYIRDTDNGTTNLNSVAIVDATALDTLKVQTRMGDMYGAPAAVVRVVNRSGLWIMQLPELTEKIATYDSIAAQDIDGAGTSIVINGARDIKVADTAAFTVPSITTINCVKDMNVLFFSNIHADSWTDTSTVRLTRDAAVLLDGVDLDYGKHGAYDRNVQSTYSTFGWSGHPYGLEAVTAGQDFTSKVYDDGEDGGTLCATNPNAVGFFALNLDSLSLVPGITIEATIPTSTNTVSAELNDHHHPEASIVASVTSTAVAQLNIHHHPVSTIASTTSTASTAVGFMLMVSSTISTTTSTVSVILERHFHPVETIAATTTTDNVVISIIYRPFEGIPVATSTASAELNDHHHPTEQIDSTTVTTSAMLGLEFGPATSIDVTTTTASAGLERHFHPVELIDSSTTTNNATLSIHYGLFESISAATTTSSAGINFHLHPVEQIDSTTSTASANLRLGNAIEALISVVTSTTSAALDARIQPKEQIDSITSTATSELELVSGLFPALTIDNTTITAGAGLDIAYAPIAQIDSTTTVNTASIERHIAVVEQIAVSSTTTGAVLNSAFAASTQIDSTTSTASADISNDQSINAIISVVTSTTLAELNDHHHPISTVATLTSTAPAQSDLATDIAPAVTIPVSTTCASSAIAVARFAATQIDSTTTTSSAIISLDWTADAVIPTSTTTTGSDFSFINSLLVTINTTTVTSSAPVSVAIRPVAQIDSSTQTVSADLDLAYQPTLNAVALTSTAIASVDVATAYSPTCSIDVLTSCAGVMVYTDEIVFIDNIVATLDDLGLSATLLKNDTLGATLLDSIELAAKLDYTDRLSATIIDYQLSAVLEV